VYTKPRLFSFSHLPSTNHVIDRPAGASVSTNYLVRLVKRFPAVLIFLATLGSISQGLAAPFIPANDFVILERARRSPADGELREIRQRGTKPTQPPADLSTSVATARKFIEKGRAESDPRYLGNAQAALASWWDQTEPPVAVLVLRATIRQSNHDFESALADLSLALKRDPSNAQAWLTRATVLQVQGRFEEAKRCLLPLMRLASELVAVTCASSVASLSGEGVKSYELLRRTLERSADATADERLWALTILAEIAGRLGRADEAEAHFKQALGIGRPDAYLFAAYADFLMDKRRPAEVVSLLRDETRADALLLRLTLAEKAVAPRAAAFESHVEMLRDRFQAARMRGDNVHRREEAMFRLYLLGQRDEALAVAKLNWDVQKEPADARIMLEAAFAASNRSAARGVAEWIEYNRLEDVNLGRLTEQITSGETKLTSGGVTSK
jgi:Tfp pilus assembly protein PilF